VAKLAWRGRKGRSVERASGQVHTNGKTHFLGRWGTAADALLAQDRAVLYFSLDRPLTFPARARRLGPASPKDCREQARHAYRLSGATSGYRGVWFDCRAQQWSAEIRHQGRRLGLGLFDDEKEAAWAVDRLACHLGLPWRNFPNRRAKPTSHGELLRELRARTASWQAPRKRGLTSRYRGVIYTPATPGRPWMACVKRNGRQVAVARFESEKDAALAHDRLALKYYRRCALNFPALARKHGPADIKTIRRLALKERKQRTTSVYLGVYLDPRRGLWVASICARRKKKYLGAYEDDKDAARAYDRAAATLHGDKAKLNFPVPPRRAPSPAPRAQRWPARSRPRAPIPSR
jgi:hypothetical protein